MCRNLAQVKPPAFFFLWVLYGQYTSDPSVKALRFIQHYWRAVVAGASALHRFCLFHYLCWSQGRAPVRIK